MKRTELEQLLPGIFQRTIVPGNPLFTLLEVMAALHEQPESILANLDAYFDPLRAPDAFVPYLAGWVDLDALLPELPEDGGDDAVAEIAPGMGRLRELVAQAAFLSQWRGTALGLLRFLETATGLRGFVIDERVPGRTFHLRITAPKDAAPYSDLIRRIIELEKPAYVTYELQLAP